MAEGFYPVCLVKDVDKGMRKSISIKQMNPPKPPKDIRSMLLVKELTVYLFLEANSLRRPTGYMSFAWLVLAKRFRTVGVLVGFKLISRPTCMSCDLELQTRGI